MLPRLDEARIRQQQQQKRLFILCEKYNAMLTTMTVTNDYGVGDDDDDANDYVTQQKV